MEKQNVEIAAFSVGRNLTAAIVGKKLILTINLDGEGVRSQHGAGPNMVIASTGGNVMIPGTKGGKLGVNYYEPV
jgi:hypothetical protein